MANKLLASQALVVILQYSVLALLCFFLFRVIRITVLDFQRLTNPNTAKSIPRKATATLQITEKGLLAADQRQFPIHETLNIGRSEHNDLVINDPTVSHEHACITQYGDHYMLSDLNSTNGTLHNKIRVQDDIILRKGDIIQIGSTIFQFEE